MRGNRYTRSQVVLSVFVAVIGLLAIRAWSTAAEWRGEGTTLSVITEPAGASLQLNYSRPFGPSPVDRMPVEPGLQVVTVAADGYQTRDTMMVVERGANTLHVALVPRQEGRAALSLSSDPTGAAVRLDFAPRIGVTPIEALPVEPGLQVVTFEADGYEARDTVLWIRPGHHHLHLELRPSERAHRAGLDEYTLPTVNETATAPTRTPRPSRSSTRLAGTVLVVTEPSAATVTLGGVHDGTTPLVLEGVEPGRHLLVIRRDGYADFRDSVTVAPGALLQINERLRAERGRLSVLVEPWGSIYLNGALQRQDSDVQFHTELPLGRHVVRVTHPTLGVWEREVDVTGDVPTRLFVSFPSAEQRPTAAPSPETPASTSPEPAPPVDPDRVYSFTDVAPQVIGGWKTVYNAARYPAAARRAGLEGRVYLSLEVDAEGRVRDARVVRGLGSGLDEEALRLVRAARFEPGTVNGTPVRTRIGTFIQFTLKR